jgi:hypothetical protein
MKTTFFAIFSLSAVVTAPVQTGAQEAPKKAPAPAQAEAAPANPVTTAPAVPAPKRTPQQQVMAFYAMCKQDLAGQGLNEILSGNPVVKPEDVKRVADGFSQLTSQMGKFIDFKTVRETAVTERTQVLRCVAHFDRQPFVNEFTFYDPGNGDWRLVHLRYDGNLATMFQEDLFRAAR